MQYIDILIFSLIAIFLIMRLKSILGSKDGFEKNDNETKDFLKRDQTNSKDDILQKNKNFVPKKVSFSGKGLKSVEKADENFKQTDFKKGAVGAYKLILQSFADGDLSQLKKLLSFEMFENFSESIRNRNNDGEDLVIKINKIINTKLLDGFVEDDVSSVTVRFETNQTRILYDKNGKKINKESVENEKVVDVWTFEKETFSSDPNWKLVETISEN